MQTVNRLQILKAGPNYMLAVNNTLYKDTNKQTQKWKEIYHANTNQKTAGF